MTDPWGDTEPAADGQDTSYPNPLKGPPPDPRDGILIGGQPLGGIVRKVRRVADLSQRELARLAGVSAGLVGAIECGRVTPSLSVLQRILNTANHRLVVCDVDGRVIVPLEVWKDTADGAGRRYPAHLDTILDPVFGEWWGDVYGLAHPPETYRRSRAWREWQRRQSVWEVRVGKYRFAPRPRRPNPEVEWQADDRQPADG